MTKQVLVIVDSTDPDIHEKLIDLLTKVIDDVFVTKVDIHEISSMQIIKKGDNHVTQLLSSSTISSERHEVKETHEILLQGALQHIASYAPKETYIETAKRVLPLIGIPYKSFNNDLHFVIDYKGKIVDYWPTTGLWRERNGNTSQRGFKNLLRYLGVPKNVY